MTARKPPLQPPGTVVAVLTLPIPADRVITVVNALERAYGRGLVVRTDLGDVHPGKLVIAQPKGPS